MLWSKKIKEFKSTHVHPVNMYTGNITKLRDVRTYKVTMFNNVLAEEILML